MTTSPTTLAGRPGVPGRGAAALDMAVGALMALTGADAEHARADLVVTARDARLDVFRLAHAVLAACSGRTAGTHRGALDAATGRWPGLLDLHAAGHA